MIIKHLGSVMIFKWVVGGRVSEEWTIGETIYNEHIYIPEDYNYGSIVGL